MSAEIRVNYPLRNQLFISVNQTDSISSELMYIQSFGISDLRKFESLGHLNLPNIELSPKKRRHLETPLSLGFKNKSDRQKIKYNNVNVC